MRAYNGQCIHIMSRVSCDARQLRCDVLQALHRRAPLCLAAAHPFQLLDIMISAKILHILTRIHFLAHSDFESSQRKRDTTRVETEEELICCRQSSESFLSVKTLKKGKDSDVGAGVRGESRDSVVSVEREEKMAQNVEAGVKGESKKLVGSVDREEKVTQKKRVKARDLCIDTGRDYEREKVGVKEKSCTEERWEGRVKDQQVDTVGAKVANKGQAHTHTHTQIDIRKESTEKEGQDGLKKKDGAMEKERKQGREAKMGGERSASDEKIGRRESGPVAEKGVKEKEREKDRGQEREIEKEKDKGKEREKERETEREDEREKEREKEKGGNEHRRSKNKGNMHEGSDGSDKTKECASRTEKSESRPDKMRRGSSSATQPAHLASVSSGGGGGGIGGWQADRIAHTKDGCPVLLGQALQLSRNNKNKESEVFFVGPSCGKHKGGLRYVQKCSKKPVHMIRDRYTGLTYSLAYLRHFCVYTNICMYLRMYIVYTCT